MMCHVLRTYKEAVLSRGRLLCLYAVAEYCNSPELRTATAQGKTRETDEHQQTRGRLWD